MKRYKGLIVVAAVVMAVLVYYVVCVAMAAGRFTDRFNEAYWVKAGDTDKKESVEMRFVPGYNEALHDRGLVRSLIKMASGDSIGLFVNLPDSVVQLMVRGLGVRDVKIEEMQVSSFFGKADQEAVYDLLSEPMGISFSEATIAKELLNVVQAPKNSDAADSIPMVKPDTSHSEPVFFILNTDKNVRLYFYQTDNESFSDCWAAWKFDVADRWRDVKQSFAAVFTGKLPEYVPTIKIGVKKVDAKVVYRAIPPHGQIVLTK